MIREWDDRLTQEEKQEAQWVRNWAAHTALLIGALPDSRELKASLRSEFPCMCQCMDGKSGETEGCGEKTEKDMKPDIEHLLAAVCGFSRSHDLCQCPCRRAVRLAEKLEDARKNEKKPEWERLDKDDWNEDEEEIDPDTQQLLDGICRFSRSHGLCQCPYHQANRAAEQMREMWMRGEDLPY